MKEKNTEELVGLEKQPVTVTPRDGCHCKTKCRICHCRRGKRIHHGTVSPPIASAASH